ncbi:TIGR00296 family protein [Candidatus Thorarchaeota archaeon]|nr:MAG: TIGR00296 family protein [Candidatus Thorarchaeota archaeon]
MSNAYSDEDGNFLVGLARKTVDEYVTQMRKSEVPSDTPKHLKEKSGVFVTLNSITSSRVALRGCIGRPYPSQPLVEAVIDSSVDSAVNDPRFPPVTPRELDTIIVDLSVLTPPMKIEYSKPEDLLNLVKVGRDGLIASRGMWRGLLLPQVPVDWKWNTLEFLEHTCNKAGLPEDAWRDPRTEFMSFQAVIFGEEKPRGNIVRDPSHPKC